MSSVIAAPRSARQIRVWLGKRAFIDHVVLDEAAAARYEAAMRQRFASCRVTNDPYAIAERSTDAAHSSGA